jgi:nicotinamide mononucleotide transporter
MKSDPSIKAQRKERRIEALAVILSLAYTWGYLRGWTPWCFGPAALGAGLLGWLCWRRNILAEAGLQLFYVGFAAYGAWLASGEQDWAPQVASFGFHLTAILLASVTTILLGWTMRRFTSSTLPWLDAFTTIFSLWATWLMVNNHHANWAYWIAIDAAAIVLYAKRGLPLGAALYAIYLSMALMGWFSL